MLVCMWVGMYVGMWVCISRLISKTTEPILVRFSVNIRGLSTTGYIFAMASKFRVRSAYLSGGRVFMCFFTDIFSYIENNWTNFGAVFGNMFGLTFRTCLSEITSKSIQLIDAANENFANIIFSETTQLKYLPVPIT